MANFNEECGIILSESDKEVFAECTRDLSDKNYSERKRKQFEAAILEPHDCHLSPEDGCICADSERLAAQAEFNYDSAKEDHDMNEWRNQRHNRND